MCGLAGKVAINGLTGLTNIIKGFEEAYFFLRPRGPDEKGVWYDRNSYFLHTRLKILDLKKTASQPMQIGNHIICYNGEIYNFMDIKKKLEKKGYIFKSSGDTEIILFAWKEWEENMLEIFDGMFSLSIWDKKNKNLFLARDRFGKKPLIYTINNNSISFSSYVSSLSKIDKAGKVDDEALSSLFRFRYIYEPLTIYENFKKLPPGSFMRFNKYGPKIKEWYNLRRKIKQAKSNKYEKNKLISLVSDSVEKRLRSDAPIGLFLSGGVDSGILLYSLSRIGKKIPCYTASFSENRNYYNEGDRAELIAKHFGYDHYKIDLKPKIIINKINKILNVCDEPFADSSAIPTYIISEFASKDVKVALSGDGGDEVFGGYRKYLSYRWAMIISLLPLNIRIKISNILRDNKNTSFGEFSRKVSRLLKNVSKNFNQMQLNFLDQMSVNEHKLLLGTEKKSLNTLDSLKESNLNDDINKVLLKDFQFSLIGDMLVKLDRYSMANSLEVRSPFLDQKIVEYAFSVPGKMKIGFFEGKKFLKEAFSSELPKSYSRLPKKGFEVPLENLLRKELKYLLEDCTKSHVLESLNIKNKEIVLNWKTDFLNGKKDNSWKLWTLISYASWAKRNHII